MNKKKIVVLTGAGISAESGIKTFRDADGLWEGHDVMQVASPQGFAANPELVLEFYNQRRAQLDEVVPNAAHSALAELESKYHVTIITQNVDDLHERGGSTNIIHLHGELRKMRSTYQFSSEENADYSELIYDYDKPIKLGDTCERGAQLRPHIVWFGEAVPMLEVAAATTMNADVLIIIGTSMQVYPAASLIGFTEPHIPKYFIDPRPAIHASDYPNLTIFAEKATSGVRRVVDILMQK